MEVIVLGSGVVGLTSAWYLSQAGHSVTVVDRKSHMAIHLHGPLQVFLKKRLNGYLKNTHL